ncbi:hypothetical protein M9H77_00969 [Catharanthus roseus]|uniref:Uncharacterized protein n=1 Tax=Catharanthus roseus TaxID=4058 RepID=A0ACC0C4C8_CATRO|nr:hypothetical protein M9H77_00969 [Catharanthus roseus]
MEKGSSSSTANASGSQNQSGNSMIRVNVKLGGRYVPFEISSDCTVKEFKNFLIRFSNDFPRGQRLIFKGPFLLLISFRRILANVMPLRSLGIVDGSKVMLMGAEPLHQRDSPIRGEALRLRKRNREAEKWMTKPLRASIDTVVEHHDRWMLTGVIGLAGRNLKSIPGDVWTVSVGVLDLRHNLIRECPARIAQWHHLRHLLLDANDISDETISWEGLASLKYLGILSLNQNHLQTVPSTLGAMTSLRKLEVGNNELKCLPAEIGLLTKLEVLKANNNRLRIVPESIGGCISLVEACSSTIANGTLSELIEEIEIFIWFGRILVDGMTLRSSGIADGSKVMLMGSEGLHQGDGPIKKEALKLTSRRPETTKPLKENTDVNHLDRWLLTGIIGLAESNLKSIPEDIWTVGAGAVGLRVLDLRHNLIRECPARIAQLHGLRQLMLDANDISDESISWEGLASLKYLAILSLNQNHLQTLPSAVGALTSLKTLEVGNNELTCLPTEIGLLTKLEVLKANNNRLHILPESLGECISLVELELSSNLLAELPETIGSLKDLKALNLSNNGLRSLPSCLFKMCAQLSTLDLHGTEITIDILRQIEGWEDFDARRQLKHQKQLDFHAINSAKFDEGADKR